MGEEIKININTAAATTFIGMSLTQIRFSRQYYQMYESMAKMGDADVKC